jgi:hypothetical protein
MANAKRFTFGFIGLLAFSSIASAQFGDNLIVNPGAEQYSGPVNGSGTFAGWTNYGAADDLYSDYPVNWLGTPPNLGTGYFFGGVPEGSSDGQGTEAYTALVQDIALPTYYDAAIDLGHTVYSDSAWLGSDLQTLSGLNDTIDYYVEFDSATQGYLGSVDLYTSQAFIKGFPNYGVYGAYFGTGGLVPVGTRYVYVELFFTREFGAASNGLADNLSLNFNNTAPGPMPGFVFASMAAGIMKSRRRRK